MEDKNVLTKQLHDKFAEYPSYKLGEKVLLHDPKVPVGKTAKLYRTWTGPFEIMETLDNFLYKLKNCQTGKIIKSRLHSNRMKSYIERKPRQTRMQDTPTDRIHPQSTKLQLPLVENAVATSNQVSLSNDNLFDTENLTQPRPAALDTQVRASNSRVAEHAQRSDVDPATDVFYAVKDVTRKRYINGEPYYFVHWEGDYPPSWEPQSNITETALAAYQNRVIHRRK